MKSKKVRGYIFSRSFMGERVPQHVQNIVIRDYCEKNNLFYLLSSVEYAMKDCHLMLEQVLNEIKSIDGVVVYSLFQLPRSEKLRSKIYKKILNNKKEMHFSVEGLKIKSKKDIDKLESIWSVRQSLPDSLKTLEV